MVRTRYEPPRNDPNLPPVNIPFDNPFNGHPLFDPDTRPKTRGWHDDADVDAYFDGCNFGVRINSLGIDFIRRNPQCQPPPTEVKFYLPPPLPPVVAPEDKPPPRLKPPDDWVEVPPGENCTACFGFTIRTKNNVVRFILGGATFYNKGALPPLWASCSHFPVLTSDFKYSGARGYQWDYSEDDTDYCVDELDGYVDYVLCVNYSSHDLVNGKLKVPSPNIDDYAYFQFPQTLSQPGEFPKRIIQISSIPWELISVDCEILPPPPPPILPPPPPPPMQCCPNIEQNDQLLRLILKRIGEPKEVTIFDEDLDRKGAQKAKKTPESLNDYLKLAVERVEIANRIIGVENFPITVSDTMLEPYKEGAFSKIFGFINGDKKRKISTIAEFIAWMSEQDSAVLGEFHQVIEYESDEKGKDGKPKKKTLVLPNVAETLKEITLLVAQMAKQNNVQTEVLFKTLFEIVATRAEATKSTTIVQDIQDFLDYPTETKSMQYGSSVSVPNYQVNKDGKPIATGTTEDHKNLLKPGKVRYVYEDWTGDNSFHDQMINLLQMASMLRAVLYQRTDNNG